MGYWMPTLLYSRLRVEQMLASRLELFEFIWIDTGFCYDFIQTIYAKDVFNWDAMYRNQTHNSLQSKAITVSWKFYHSVTFFYIVI